MNNGLKEFGSFIILGQLLTIITQLRTTVDIMPVVDILVGPVWILRQRQIPTGVMAEASSMSQIMSRIEST